MSEPLVSVVIPSYNVERFVKQAIDSALAQTYKHAEIIVVDDGSTDGTKDVVAPYAEAKQVIYIYQKNGGLSAARNTGIRAAKGKYIALLDADDIFFPTKLERQVAYLEEHPECDMSYCDLYLFWDHEPEKLLTIRYQFYSGDDVLPELVKKEFIAPLTMVIRKSVFERFGYFDEKFRRSEDLEFKVRALSRGARICFLPEKLGKVRLRREGNLQSFKSQPEVKKTALDIFERLYNESTPAERERLQLVKYLKMYRLKTAFAYLENEDKKNAAVYMRQSFNGSAWEVFMGAVARGLMWMIPKVILAKMLRRYHLWSQASHLDAV